MWGPKPPLLLPIASRRDKLASDTDQHNGVAQFVLSRPLEGFVEGVSIVNEYSIFPLHYNFVVS
jgi:hypothetical protein